MKFLLSAILLSLLPVVPASGQAFFSSHRTLVNGTPMVSRSIRYDEAMLRPVRRSVAPPQAAPTIVESEDGPTVAGRRAILRRGIAYAPSEAPRAVKELIWAVNRIHRMPYKWGGGHGSFRDNGYDCSGTVSYALHHAGVLRSPMTSSGLLNWGQRGRGNWVTVYARRGHVFATVAGLRLDAMGQGRSNGPRWYSEMRSTRGFLPRSIAGL